MRDDRPLLEDEVERGEVEQGDEDEDEGDGEVQRRPDIFVYLSFVTIGAGMLWPFNAFVTANDYFGLRFKGTAGLENYSSWITSTFTLVNLITTLHLTRSTARADLDGRIRGAGLTATALFLAIAFATKASIGPTMYFYILLVAVAVAGFATGLLQNGTFGILGAYHKACTPAVMIGQGIAGVSPAIVSLLSASASAAPEAAGSRAFYYFISAAVVSGASSTAHFTLTRRSDAPKRGRHGQGDVKARDRFPRRLLRQPVVWAVFLVRFACVLFEKLLTRSGICSDARRLSQGHRLRTFYPHTRSRLPKDPYANLFHSTRLHLLECRGPVW